jgi:hypothetical protein
MALGCGSDRTGPVDNRGDVAKSVDTAITRLNLSSYRVAILGLTQFGDRTQGTQRNSDALDWIEAELQSHGYTNVERHGYLYQGAPRENIYATKVGVVHPDRMYIISAHMDGRGGGEAADDDASGCALVLEIARVFASPDFETDISVRFIFWNNEETGLQGSAAYVAQRAPLRGIEDPPGSGAYPEPDWLGVIQHDMVMFDHGLPPGPAQAAAADIDIEYQAVSSYAAASLTLAEALSGANERHASHYPAEVSSNMNNTDSKSFQNHTASVSVRENRRIAEIGAGSNPHWHKSTDNYATYLDADFLLGFNAVQTTLGAVGELVGLRDTRTTAAANRAPYR